VSRAAGVISSDTAINIDGLPLEKVLKNMITVKFIRPPVRKYQMENLYEKKFIMVRKKKGGQKSVKKKKR